jgi:sugar lactone lactonase YvrE
VNDVVVTRDAAFFTDSFQPILYKVPLGPSGALVDASQVEVISLAGDWDQVAVFNANGIDATPDGKTLVLVNSTVGALYRVEPMTGVAVKIDLGNEVVTAGDGILLEGRKVYVMRNQLNQIAVVLLDPKMNTGTVVDSLTDTNFDVPTTIAAFGDDIYAVNARFGTPPTPDTEYDVVRVSKH